MFLTIQPNGLNPYIFWKLMTHPIHCWQLQRHTQRQRQISVKLSKLSLATFVFLAPLKTEKRQRFFLHKYLIIILLVLKPPNDVNFVVEVLKSLYCRTLVYFKDTWHHSDQHPSRCCIRGHTTVIACNQNWQFTAFDQHSSASIYQVVSISLFCVTRWDESQSVGPVLETWFEIWLWGVQKSWSRLG